MTKNQVPDELRLVRTDLYAFYRYYVGRSFKENVSAPHIEKLATALMEVYRGDYKRLCVAMPPRHKLANSTPVLTTNGWTTHGDLKVGDYVYGLNGEPTKIIGTSEESPCDRLVTFSDGSKILAHKDHLWSVQKKGVVDLEIKTTNEIKEDLIKLEEPSEYEYELPPVKGIQRRLSITNIEKVKPKNGKCIEISNSDGIYLAGENLIPTHNSKSSMITEAFPLWLIFHNPNLNILIVSNSAGLSEKFGIALRELVNKYGAEFNIYLSDVKHAATYLMFSDEDGNLYNGSIRLVGAGGSITGQDVDYLIIDDPYEGFSDITPGQLEKKINWFKTIIEQRIEPHSRMIILHTRWHSNDLQGYLKEKESEDYEFITFPAISKDNTPLWPERYTLEELEKKRESLGPRLFNSIYQQEPLDESGDFFDINLVKWNKPETDYEIKFSCRAWDTASSDNSKGDNNDYTVGIKMVITDNDDFIITDMERGQYGNNTKNKIFNTAHHDGVNTTIVIETGVAAAGKFLFEEWVTQLPGFFVEQAKPLTSKVDRATPFKNAILDGKVYIDIIDNELREDLIKEFKSFPEGKHDDIVDACAHAYNYLSEVGGGYIGLDVARIKVR